MEIVENVSNDRSGFLLAALSRVPADYQLKYMLLHSVSNQLVAEAALGEAVPLS